MWRTAVENHTHTQRGRVSDPAAGAPARPRSRARRRGHSARCSAIRDARPVLSVVPLRLRGAPPARHPAAERVHDGDLRRCLVRRFPAAEVRLRPQVLLSIPKYTGLAFYSNNASAIHIAEAYGITEATIVYLQPEVLDVACVLVLL